MADVSDKPDNRSITRPLAHVRQLPNGEWEEHFLSDHLPDVARLAAEFAASFGGDDWAHQAGLWHDLGKFREKFQRYIKSVSGYEKQYDTEAHIKDEETPGRVDHSTAGAIHAIDKLGEQGRILAYLIAGHHAGLPDWNSPEAGRSSLLQRVMEEK